MAAFLSAPPLACTALPGPKTADGLSLPITSVSIHGLPTQIHLLLGLQCFHFMYVHPVKLFFGVFLAVPWDMWDLSSATKYRTHTPCIGSAELTTGPPGKSSSSKILFSHDCKQKSGCDILDASKVWRCFFLCRFELLQGLPNSAMKSIWHLVAQ